MEPCFLAKPYCRCFHNIKALLSLLLLLSGCCTWTGQVSVVEDCGLAYGYVIWGRKYPYG